MPPGLKKMPIIVSLCLAALFVSCTGDSAEDLFETAQFEELQNNEEHARKLYEEILEKYPQSEYAGKAEERLSALKE